MWISNKLLVSVITLKSSFQDLRSVEFSWSSDFQDINIPVLRTFVVWEIYTRSDKQVFPERPRLVKTILSCNRDGWFSSLSLLPGLRCACVWQNSFQVKNVLLTHNHFLRYTGHLIHVCVKEELAQNASHLAKEKHFEDHNILLLMKDSEFYRKKINLKMEGHFLLWNISAYDQSCLILHVIHRLFWSY